MGCTVASHERDDAANVLAPDDEAAGLQRLTQSARHGANCSTEGACEMRMAGMSKTSSCFTRVPTVTW